MKASATGSASTLNFGLPALEGLGYREVEIIREATPEDFRFCGFVRMGSAAYAYFVQLYSVLGMEYYNDGGKIQVVG